MNLKSLIIHHKSSKGFTLIELVVVIAILGILVVTSLAVLDPSGDLSKANDAVRKLDLEHIQTALDIYYHDHNCYPTSVPFGSIWQENGTVYMQKVPQDPNYASTGWAYVYQTDTANSCPQWNVLYSHLIKPPTNYVDTCPLLNVCGYMQTAYSYCVFSGSIDCSYVKANALPTPMPSPTSGPTAMPTPTPGGGGGGQSCSCADAQYDFNGHGTSGSCDHVSSGAQYCDAGCSVPCTP